MQPTILFFLFLLLIPTKDDLSCLTCEMFKSVIFQVLRNVEEGATFLSFSWSKFITKAWNIDF